VRTKTRAYASPERRRQARLRALGWQLRPRRAMCGGCGRTHVLLPAGTLARRADSVPVIGEALAGAAAGQGCRTIAGRVGRAATTLRAWLHRMLADADAAGMPVDGPGGLRGWRLIVTAPHRPNEPPRIRPDFRVSRTLTPYLMIQVDSAMRPCPDGRGLPLLSVAYGPTPLPSQTAVATEGLVKAAGYAREYCARRGSRLSPPVVMTNAWMPNDPVEAAVACRISRTGGLCGLPMTPGRTGRLTRTCT
jgi:hypothetical protein